MPTSRTRFPIVWADTATQNLLIRLKEITGDLKRTLADVPPAERFVTLEKWIHGRAVPAYFQRTHPTTEALESMRTRNNLGNKGIFSADHLVDGLWGLQPDMHESFENPLQQEDLLRVLGCVSWVACLSKMDPAEMSRREKEVARKGE